ncbi:hydrolase [Sporomusa acidovorans]|uniref:HD domain-containing protein n=1 Tax=Sporomusa acidovorans (strain ATCC 49682 / DSM 3132 / Mol) TaxID=1123286 RepID=A0ABZ3J9T6_SPOA4|nr:hydrolase [Sporomusa acidovorans]OZC16042.1 hypothetical protein SPACI_44080 [Sporomusa acidovorans DSM 3132]SDD88685.1 hypothetical protein SAMN04488499_100589 [Sporomusa acidovorans]
MNNKFNQLLVDTQRPGIDALLDYLQNETDFYTAPASTNYHGANEAGLLEHSLAVYDHLQKLVPLYFDEWDESTLCIVSLLHDVCKMNFYKTATRNVKNTQTGIWEQVPYITIDDQLPLGHGEKSVIILQRFIPLSIEEIMSIRWHMAGFDDAARQYGGGQALSLAMRKYPLITVLHMADLAAGLIEGM